MKWFGNFFFLAVFLGTSYLFADDGAVQWKYIRVPQKAVTREFTEKYDFIRDHLNDEEYALGYVRKDRFKNLTNRFGREVVELDAREWSENEFDIKTLLPVNRVTRPTFGPFEDYHTYTSLTAELKSLAEKFPKLVTLVSAGTTVEGRQMWYVRLTNKEVLEPTKPKLLYISSMHGDEVTGKEMMIYLIRDLLWKHGTDTEVTKLLDFSELFIMPSMNPDGTERHQRFNAKGVDLNRDFPELNEAEFSMDGRAPETKAIMELHRENHFLTALNFHGGALCVNIPWDSKANQAGTYFADNALMLSLAKEYAELNDPMFDVNEASFKNGVTYGFEWYQILGGMQDWASFFRQSVHATIEISNVKWPNASSLPTFWRDNSEALFQYLVRGATGVHLKVTDSQGEVVKNVTVETSSSKRGLFYPLGYIHRSTTLEPQQVIVRAPGFVSQTVLVNPSQFVGEYQTVTLLSR